MTTIGKMFAGALITMCMGCANLGTQVTEGTDVVVGITVPGSDGVLQLNALNYLSGFRMVVPRRAAVTVEYSTVSTNSFFGCVSTTSDKRVKTTVTPLDDQPE